MLSSLGAPALLLVMEDNKELKNHLKGTQIPKGYRKKHHKNNAVRFTCVLAAGTTCWVIIFWKQWFAVFIGESGTQKKTKRNSFSRVKSVCSVKWFVSLSRLNRYLERPAMISKRVVFQLTKPRTWQHMPRASAIRLTIGLGWGFMLKGNGWGRVAQKEKAQPLMGLGCEWTQSKNHIKHTLFLCLRGARCARCVSNLVKEHSSFEESCLVLIMETIIVAQYSKHDSRVDSN